MELIIRTVGKQDKQDINELVEVSNKVDNLGYSLTDEWLDYVIKAAGEGIFVAFCKYKLVGLATCMINQINKNLAAVNVIVHPDYRNLGFGSKLYNQAISYLKGKSICELEAYVKKRLESSLAFAENRGFYPVLYSWQMDLDIREAKSDLQDQGNSIFTFREATIKDNRAYTEIIGQVFGDELGDNALEQVLIDNSIRVYLLEREGKAAGSTTIQYKTNLSTGYIYDVALLKEYRGQGLGSNMLKNCINELKKNNIGKASLLVTGENNSALAVYHKLGFKEVDIDIVMQKKI